MNFFDYLKEAKDEVVKAKKTKIEYADGAWGVIPTMTTLDVKDLAKSGKIKEYTNLDQKTNPWLMKNLAAAKPMQEGMIKTFPSIVVSESKPIILLIITLLKRMKENDKITEKVISIVKAGAAKYPKGRKEDVNEAFEIESQAFTKGIIARSNEVVLYCNTADGGTLVKNNLFRTLDQLVKYVSEYKNWLETKDSENADDSDKITKFQNEFREAIEAKLIAKPKSIIKDDFYNNIDKIVSFTNGSEDQYIALLGKINGNKYRLPLRCSSENLKAIFSRFETPELTTNSETTSTKPTLDYFSGLMDIETRKLMAKLKDFYDNKTKEEQVKIGPFKEFWFKWFEEYKKSDKYKILVAKYKKIAEKDERKSTEKTSGNSKLDELVSEYFSRVRPKLKEKFDSLLDTQKKAFGDFDKYFEMWKTSHKSKPEWKDTLKRLKEESEEIDTTAVRKYLKIRYGTNELKDEAEIPSKFYTLNNPLLIKSTLDGFVAQISFVNDKDETKTANITTTNIPQNLVYDLYKTFEGKEIKLDVTNILSLNLTNSEKTTITFDDAKISIDKSSEIYADMKDVFYSIADMFYNADPKKSDFISRGKNNEIILKKITSAYITKKDGQEVMTVIGVYSEYNTEKTFSLNLKMSDAAKLILPLFGNNSETVLKQFGLAKEAFEKNSKDKNYKKYELVDAKLPKLKPGGVKVIADAYGRNLADKTSNNIIPQSFNWNNVKKQNVDKIKETYKGISNIVITSIK